MNGEQEMHVQKSQVVSGATKENLKGGSHLGGQVIGGRMIFKLILTLVVAALIIQC
jgi:hypothetical protein